jgi:hypothetical protein
MSKIEEAELDNLSDEEREALEGEDLGSAADTEAAAKALEAAGDDDDAAGDDAAAAAAAATDPPADLPPAVDDEPAVLRLQPPVLDGHDEELAKLLDARKTVREQYRQGDIAAEDKDRLEDEINDKISDLRAAQQNAAFVEKYNQQADERDYLNTLARVKAELREEGTDYDKNPVLMRNWDAKVRALALDPANAGHDGEWYLKEAHKQVMSEFEQTAQALGFKRGEAPKPPKDAVREAVAARRQTATAKSLSTLPAAAQDTGHDNAEFSGLDRLDGEDLENAIARMSPEQQDRWARA